MRQHGRKTRSRGRSGVGAALLRAMLLVGPLALALVFGVAPRGDRLVTASGGEGLDTMTTGSVSSSRFSFAVGSPRAAGSLGPCLRFPDGTDRGAC